jgi:hypothetical protein
MTGAAGQAADREVETLTQPTGVPVSEYQKTGLRFRLRERLQTNGAAIIVATVFALLCGSLLVDDPGRIAALTIDNPTPYDIRVDVRGDEADGWTVLTSARQHCAAFVESSIDHGERWVFRLRAQDRATAEIAVSRSDLERANWHFAVPATVAQQWEAGGIPHPPRQSC